MNESSLQWMITFIFLLLFFFLSTEQVFVIRILCYILYRANSSNCKESVFHEYFYAFINIHVWCIYFRLKPLKRIRESRAKIKNVKQSKRFLSLILTEWCSRNFRNGRNFSVYQCEKKNEVNEFRHFLSLFFRIFEIWIVNVKKKNKKRKTSNEWHYIVIYTLEMKLLLNEKRIKKKLDSINSYL